MQQHQGIQELSFSQIIGDRFGRYSKYIIQDRALPDIRDGLKPVQRRILFAMFQERNTHENPYRKSAKTVGNVIGNYHPHGDSSVYEAMVRMSQDWKLRDILIDMHGNNGSMDGDPAAAMRYTEARLSPIASELLEDIKYDTVDFILNFDDTVEEPQVLPARFPNLLVNGATGISAGYATEIPPHNLGEVIDAIIYMLTHQTYHLDDVIERIPAPDFPTGGIIQGAKDLKTAYENGQGKITVRSLTEIEQLRGGKKQIVASQLPYEVNKAKLIQRLDDIRISRKIEGIADVRDESDRNGVRVVIELKKDVDEQGILAYLFKHTELQINYHFNMVAINQRRPMVVGLMTILEAYIAHQKEVIRRRTIHHLDHDQKRLHIVDGLIRMISILDEVIQVIRRSESKQDAKQNLVQEFEFSIEQAEAIVSLQLYRLTNTDITALQNEKLALNESILMYQNILAQDKILKQVLVNELKIMKKRYASPRRTLVEAEVETLEIETHVIVPAEQVYVSVTKQGYVKRTSLRSFASSDIADFASREFDYPLFIEEMSTHDHLLILTNKGNYIHLPVHELTDIKWKEMGVHLSQSHQLLDGEQIVACFPLAAQAENMDTSHLVFVTAQGMVKQTALSDFTTYRSYKTRTAKAIQLKDDQDQVVAVECALSGIDYQLILLTREGYGLRYNLDLVSSQGLKAKGIVGIKLKADDQVAASFIVDQVNKRPQVLLLTQRGHVKRMDVSQINEQGRASQGVQVLKPLKTNPHHILEALYLDDHHLTFMVEGDTGYQLVIEPLDYPIMDRLSNGSSLNELDQLGQVINLYQIRLNSLTSDKV